jgi:hypothetical protein
VGQIIATVADHGLIDPWRGIAFVPRGPRLVDRAGFLAKLSPWMTLCRRRARWPARPSGCWCGASPAGIRRTPIWPLWWQG